MNSVESKGPESCILGLYGRKVYQGKQSLLLNVPAAPVTSEERVLTADRIENNAFKSCTHLSSSALNEII